MSPTPSAPRRGRSRLALALLPAALLVTGCAGGRDLYEGSFGLGFPEPVTDRADEIYELWLGSVAAAAVVGFAVGALILWTAFRYRRVSDQLPRQVRYNLPIEVLYTVVPFVIIAVLFYYTTLTQNFVNELTPDEEGSSEVLEIGVVGFQWNWTFNYTQDDVSVTGIPGQPPQLVLPTDTPIRFTMTSPDVIHSFWVPAFLFKRDVIPGRANTFEVTITKEGEYIGRCAELCGEKHAAMNFSVRAVSEQEYESYIGDLRGNPANRIGSGAGTGTPLTPEEIAEQTAGRDS